MLHDPFDDVIHTILLVFNRLFILLYVHEHIGSAGMSFSTWFCVDKFSDPRNDPHPVRVLTIIKEAGQTQKLCLCLVVSARDKALLVSTRETALPPQGIFEFFLHVNYINN